MVSEHYFTRTPAGDPTRRPLTALLAGKAVHVHSAGGVFSPRRVDTGTSLLLECAPPPPARGELLDLGCGWGPIALTLALLSPEATVWAVDVNDRALELVRENSSALGLPGVRPARPEEVPAQIRFQTIWSNPPIRVGKKALHDMLAAWLPRLAADGEAWLVVQKNLGADSLQGWLNEQPGLTAERAGSRKGYRIVRVGRSPGQAPALRPGAAGR
ncbi:MAG TPA: methyltransferase [Microbacteriaceae bacterium]|nr:methyltransferase [Microbacteriaceae bacterium]